MSSNYRNIHFLPFQNQSLMPAVYRLGQIFCLPSQGPRETWGLVVNEAMACSRTILVSNKCGCAINLVKNGINGYVFESNQLESLIEKLNILFAKKDKLIEMGKASYNIIQNWNFDAIVEGIEKGLKKGSYAE